MLWFLLVFSGLWLPTTSSLCVDWCSNSLSPLCLYVCGDLPQLHFQLALTQAKLEAAKGLYLIGETQDDQCHTLLSQQEAESQALLEECRTTLDSVETHLDQYIHSSSNVVPVLVGAWVFRLCRSVLSKFR